MDEVKYLDKTYLLDFVSSEALQKYNVLPLIFMKFETT
jgi:hypothetical protein